MTLIEFEVGYGKKFNIREVPYLKSPDITHS
jgi:hypothetical protein